MTSSPLPPPTRYITTNDDKGDSLFYASLPSQVPIISALGGSFQRLCYTTTPPPVKLTNDTDISSYNKAATQTTPPPPLVQPGGGSVIWYNDMPPGFESSMHRTVSVDFVVQLIGEVELTLSSGETRIVKPGDVVIQRSTLHKWRNPSRTEWARLMAIVTECKPVVAGNGETLGTLVLNS